MICTLTVTAKGQVTLKKEVLRHIGVTPGDRIEVDLLPSGRAEFRAAKPTRPIGDFIGFLKSPRQAPPSIEEINDAIADGWAGRR